MENKENTLEDQKKTDFPDLERLPDHNSFKHFLSVLYNMPKSFFEDLYKKYFLKDKIELEKDFLISVVIKFAVPSAVFRATFPVKPSETITLTSPSIR